jgi:hypothetical protein
MPSDIPAIFKNDRRASASFILCSLYRMSAADARPGTTPGKFQMINNQFAFCSNTVARVRSTAFNRPYRRTRINIPGRIPFSSYGNKIVGTPV